ncbi:MAG TPA: hypothetical protein PKY31_17025 [Spirochaetota bacterium]|nr:hypothetical protein [Spirochaetota bacterium]
MKKILVLCMVLCCGALYAYDWGQDGITVVNKAEQDGTTELTLKDAKENTFSLKYMSEPDDAMLKNVVKLKGDLFGWKNMTVDSLKFVYDQGGLEISLMPKKFEYEGKNINNYLPSGMQFTYTYLLQYNFRINVNRLFIRIAGDYDTEERVCRKIVDAINNPKEYIRKRDPEYLLTKLEQLEETLHKLRTATLMLHNSGFLSGPEPVSRDVVEKVVGMRLLDPVISREKIAENLEKQKVKATSREINLILNVYFNDFKN